MVFRLCTAVIIVASISYNAVVASDAIEVVDADVHPAPSAEQSQVDLQLEMMNRVGGDVTTQSPEDEDEIVRQVEQVTAAARRAAFMRFVEKPPVYDLMGEIVSNITGLINNKADVDTFINAYGLDRIVNAHLKKPNLKLRANLVALTKKLLAVSPDATKDNLSPEIVQPLLYLLESENPGNKAHIVDIITKFLPGNPLAQKEVMQNGGFQSFDKIIPKAGTKLKVMLISLLNTIIDEHRAVMDDESLVKTAEKKQQYADVNLFEALSLGYVCEGFSYLFYDLFKSSPDEIEVILPTTGLMERILPFCKDRYVDDLRMTELVKEMGEFYDKEEKSIKDKFVTEKEGMKKIIGVVKKYAEDLAPQKDEL